MKRIWSIAVLLVGVLAMVLVVPAQQQQRDDALPLPTMKTVTPALALVGQLVTITGENLGKRVAEVYLTTGKKDWKVEIVSQSETRLVAKIANGTPMGHYRLMVLTTDNPGVFVEQPLVMDIVFVPTGD